MPLAQGAELHNITTIPSKERTDWLINLEKQKLQQEDFNKFHLHFTDDTGQKREATSAPILFIL